VIASIRGRVLAIRGTTAILETAGVGFSIIATPAGVATLRIGAEAQLTTLLVVRDDALTLYGFADEAERAAFEAVQTVSGIGPRIAMAVLAAMTPDQLARAVEASDLALLQRVPGIGKKGASRLVLELAGKLAVDGSAAHRDTAPSPVREEVGAGLVALGWTVAQAEAALDEVAATQGAPSSAAETLRAALRTLGARRG
jgi:Holliday junction DNA helicase RuvA